MRGPALLSLLPLKPGAPAARRRAIEAVYADGVLRPAEPLPLEDGATIPVTLLPAGQAPPDAQPSAAVPVPARSEPQPQQTQPADAARSDTPAGVRTRSGGVLASSDRVAWLLFGLGMLIYLFIRLWQITEFPIYFFADEATHAVYAQDLLDKGFRDGRGSFLPIYFEAAGNRWTPLLSVYVHAISVALFGETIFVTRATSALVSVLAPLAVALILKLVFRSRYWWAGPLLMAVAPAWFLHSRTGFETVMMSSFFACFLLCYLLYRTRSPRYFFAAILFGAVTFYTYSGGQMLMLSVGAVLAVSDIRYHLKHWRTTLAGVGLLALLALPLLHFRATNPQFVTATLRTMDSYWFRDLTPAQKMAQFVRTWAQGLSPAYWFVPSQTLLVRHRMEGYGNLSLWLLPFFLIGFGWCLWKIKSPAPRAVLLTALVTPIGAALIEEVGITRVLAFTIPATLLIALGLEASLAFLGRRLHVRYAIAAGVVFGVLSAASLGMLRDALVHGPLWFRDYGLYGMQYGAHQLFEEAIPDLLKQDPNTQIMMTSTWANGADTFIRFFMPLDQQNRVMMQGVDYFMQGRRTLTPNMVLVMTPSEYERAQASGKFQPIAIERVVPYPDGTPGFYFGRLTYAEDLDQVLAQEREERSRPVEAIADIDGQSVMIAHSQLDMGQLSNLFDGDTFTLARGLEANPLVFEFTFPEPRPIAGLDADFGSMDFTLTTRLFEDANSEPKVYQETFRGQPPDPHVEMTFDDAPSLVKKIRVEVQQLNAGDDVHIHVRELHFRE